MSSARRPLKIIFGLVVGLILALELAALAQGILIMFTMGQEINRFLDTFYFVFGATALILPLTFKFSINKLLLGFIGIFILLALYITLAYFFWIVPSPKGYNYS